MKKLRERIEHAQGALEALQNTVVCLAALWFVETFWLSDRLHVFWWRGRDWCSPHRRGRHPGEQVDLRQVAAVG